MATVLSARPSLRQSSYPASDNTFLQKKMAAVDSENTTTKDTMWVSQLVGLYIKFLTIAWREGEGRGGGGLMLSYDFKYI